MIDSNQRDPPGKLLVFPVKMIILTYGIQDDLLNVLKRFLSYNNEY